MTWGWVAVAGGSYTCSIATQLSQGRLRAQFKDRTWCEHRVVAHNLVKISVLAEMKPAPRPRQPSHTDHPQLTAPATNSFSGLSS
jgi:hypothetical protein